VFFEASERKQGNREIGKERRSAFVFLDALLEIEIVR